MKLHCKSPFRKKEKGGNPFTLYKNPASVENNSIKCLFFRGDTNGDSRIVRRRKEDARSALRIGQDGIRCRSYGNH